MSTKLKVAAFVVVSAGLTGCVGSPEHHETTPVEVETAQGTVTCQLYTRERVMWDRSINRPNAMDVKVADEICREAGRRWANEG